MKRLVARILTLCLIIAAGLFAAKHIQKTEGSLAQIPAPSLKPRLETKLSGLRLDMSKPIEPGHYRRLSLDEFFTKDGPTPDNFDNINGMAPKNGTVYTSRSNPIDAITPQKNKTNNLQSLPHIDLTDVELNTAEHTSLSTISSLDQNRFIDRIVDMAEASPVKPNARNCGSLQYNSNSKPKHSKVKSVAMKRQLTERTSVGVEYVYKDGCYKNAIPPSNIGKVPGDDGVNFRVNMKF